MGMVVNRFEIYLVSLDPTVGGEIRKTRPAIVISPDEMNHHINTVIVAPMTTHGKLYPTRIPIVFEGKEGKVVLDQLRTVDKRRLIKKIGELDEARAQEIVFVLQEMFAY